MTTTENSTIDPTHEPSISAENVAETTTRPQTGAMGEAEAPHDSDADVREAGTGSGDVPTVPVDSPAVDADPESDRAAEAAPESGRAAAGTGETADTAGEATTELVVEPAVERPAPVADEVLLASVDVARAALLEVTPAETIGEPVGHLAEDDHVLSLFFDSTLRGYPGWHWTVTLSRAGDENTVTVLETELMPGETALLAPEWVPWSERLADYQASQEVAENEAKALAEAAAVLDESDDDDDEGEFSILHAGDVDGVDVDEIDDDESDDDESDDDESDDDDDD
ncbi:MAG: DUF3027 domain-containing protein, partial [Mycetocola sp.]